MYFSAGQQDVGCWMINMINAQIGWSLNICDEHLQNITHTAA